MENIILIGTILSVHVFAWLTPGPISVLIIRNALVYSRKTGIWTGVGNAIGNFVHIAYSIVGIAFLISTLDVALILVKFLGAGYLAYLGIKTLLMKSGAQETQTSGADKDISPLEAVKIGFLASILNPNASFFFASIFATVMSSGSPFWVVGFLGVAMSLNSFVMASILSIFFTQEKIRAIYAKYEYITNVFLGVALLLLALLIAVR